ncbi:hypothetical protein HZB90_00670, partial [archaeon]|nr:hypothetical protein [archaeon]
FFAITILSFLMTKEERSKLVKGIVINIATFAVLALAWYVRLHNIV